MIEWRLLAALHVFSDYPLRVTIFQKGLGAPVGQVFEAWLNTTKFHAALRVLQFATALLCVVPVQWTFKQAA